MERERQLQQHRGSASPERKMSVPLNEACAGLAWEGPGLHCPGGMGECFCRLFTLPFFHVWPPGFSGWRVLGVVVVVYGVLLPNFSLHNFTPQV